jgi:hypothetical protein
MVLRHKCVGDKVVANGVGGALVYAFSFLPFPSFLF